MRTDSSTQIQNTQEEFINPATTEGQDAIVTAIENITIPAPTSTVTQVASSATSVQLLASTAGRRGAYFFNDSTAIAYIKLGTTSATNSYTIKMAAGSFYELPYPCYTGRIDCIWASANGVMAITEIT